MVLAELHSTMVNHEIGVLLDEDALRQGAERAGTLTSYRSAGNPALEFKIAGHRRVSAGNVENFVFECSDGYLDLYRLPLLPSQQGFANW